MNASLVFSVMALIISVLGGAFGIGVRWAKITSIDDRLKRIEAKFDLVLKNGNQ